MSGFERYQPQEIPSVDLSIVAEAADRVAGALTAGEPSVEVVFAPGDSTEYRLVVAKATAFVGAGAVGSYRYVGAGELLVAMLTPTVRTYWWGPGNSSWTDPHYVAEHWALEPWTARVLAAFLNMLRDELAATAGVTL